MSHFYGSYILMTVSLKKLEVELSMYLVNTNSRYCLRDIYLFIRKLYPKDFQKERERKKVKNPFYKGQFPKRV